MSVFNRHVVNFHSTCRNTECVCRPKQTGFRTKTVLDPELRTCEAICKVQNGLLLRVKRPVIASFRLVSLGIMPRYGKYIS
jgi:hypothetical protein